MTGSIIERIAEAYKRDQSSNKIAVEATDLPLSFEAITQQWLTSVLCKSAPGARVTSFSLGPVDVGSSNRRKIRVVYNDAGRAAGLPDLLFCKASHDLANRILLGVSGGAHCESFFYQCIRGLLDIEAPRPYFAQCDVDSFNSMIILNDISEEVTEFCSDKTAISRSRAESQVTLLGRMHGGVYGSPQLQQLIQELPTWPQYFERTFAFGLEAGSNQGFLTAESVIPARLYKRYAEIWPATLISVALHDTAPLTLSHGDVHLKNWYVAGSGEMGLGDWQCCTRGMWGRDVAYAISSALKPEDRRAWEGDLIKLYLAEMHAAGGPLIAFDDAWLVYRQQLITALTWWTVTLTPPEGMPNMQPRDTALEFIRRISIAMDDVDTLNAFR